MIYQGAGGGTTDFVPFTVTVVAPTTPIPEPVTLVLLGTELAGVVGAARRRRKAARVE